MQKKNIFIKRLLKEQQEKKLPQTLYTNMVCLKWPFKISFSALLGTFVLNLCISLSLGADRDYKIVCYFTNWAVKRPGMGSFLPEHVDPCLCTHIIYSFSEMKDNKLFPMEKYDHADGDKPGFFERFNNLKFKNPKLKTLIAVGGWVKFEHKLVDDKLVFI